MCSAGIFAGTWERLQASAETYEVVALPDFPRNTHQVADARKQLRHCRRRVGGIFAKAGLARSLLDRMFGCVDSGSGSVPAETYQVVAPPGFLRVTK